MKMLFVLALHLGLLRTCLGLCYYPNGDLAKDDHPCDPDAEHSPCCAAPTVGKACLANGLCLSPEDIYARGSCTDPTWMSPECPNYCTHKPSQGWDMVSCSNLTKTDTSWCCIDSPQCCESGRGRIDMPLHANTWALWDSTKTQWAVVSPRSTAAATTSTTSSTPSASTSGSSTGTTGTNSGASEPSKSSSQSGEASASATATGGEQSSEATSSTGLSTGAQAGIGVGAAVGALLIAAVAYLWWKLNKANKTAAESQWLGAAAHPPPAPASSYYPQDPAAKYELQGERETHELQGQNHYVQGDGRSSELGSHASYAVESPLAGNYSGRQ